MLKVQGETFASPCFLYKNLNQKIRNMKKIIVVAAMVLAATGAFAQAGSLFFGGSIGFSTGKTTTGGTEYKTSSFTFSPKAEYFLQEQLSVYGEFQYNHNKYGDSKTSVGGLFIGAAYYVPFGEKVSVYGAGKVGFNFGDVTGFQVAVAPAIQFAPNDKLAFYSTLGSGLYFTTRKNDSNNNYKSHEFGFSLLDGISFGVKFRLL